MGERNEERPDVALTRHAEARMNQRGVTMETLRRALDWHDRAVPVGEGCSALSLSPQRERALREAGVAPALLDRVRPLVVLLAENGAVVTVMNRETWFARFVTGRARLTARDRARMAERRRRGGCRR